MNRQNLFEALQRVCGFTALESDMDEIIRAVELDNPKKGFVVFTPGYEEGFDGLIQLSNTLKTLDEAENFGNSWKNKTTYIYELIR